ncbi:MAG: hypothetical protein L3J66_00635 [Bacteroidales bacterium]|nr:hypothetical protein [Bacteroidales bacterium]
MGEKPENINERPEQLTILCILTFVGSGMSLLANGFLFLTLDAVKQVLAQETTYSFLGTEIKLDFLLEISPLFFLIQSLLLAATLLGAVQMWNLKKAGFHLYTLAQILLLIVPKLFINNLPFPLLELLISAGFVYLYFKNLSYLR